MVFLLFGMLVGTASSSEAVSDEIKIMSSSSDTNIRVTINQALGQSDPTGTSTINFAVVFSKSVSDFATGDVSLTGTAGATTATVTGDGKTYNVAVTGMNTSGTVIASIEEGVAHDEENNANRASTSSDNTVTYDAIAPTVTINQAPGQSDPTGTSPINFAVVFSKPVSDFATGDVSLTGTAGATTAIITGSGMTYNVVVTDMAESGTVIASIPEGVAHDSANNANRASTSSDNTVTYDANAPTVTINQASGQSDPTGTSPINFTVVFSKSVSDFTTGDVSLTGTAGARTATVTGNGTTYNVAVTDIAGSGTVIASISEGVAHDSVNNANRASTSSDNTVTYDANPPTVTINQASGQSDPTGTSPINFAVVFSKSVSDFATGDVSLTGTAGATTATVTGGGTTYNVAVTGMNASGTVIASISAGVAHDSVNNANRASTSSDNTVTYDATAPTVTINQASGQFDPTGTSPINFAVVFSKPVSDFVTGDVTISGTSGANTVTVTGSGMTYNVAVTGMARSGTVIASISAGVAHDSANNANSASTSSDNIVTYDTNAPTVTINQASGQSDPTGTSPINFDVVFSKPVSDFAAGDINLTGTAGATTAIITGSGMTYNVVVTGMAKSGTVIASISAGVAHDSAYNANRASTSSDNTVTYDSTAPTVTINQASGQSDPTGTSPLNFAVVFSKPVSDFATGDVSLTGTAGARNATVTGNGNTYNVAVTGMAGSGTVIASIFAGVAHDSVNNANRASTSSDNTVTYDIQPPAITFVSPTPEDGSTNTNGNLTFKISLNEKGYVQFNWQGVNESMLPSGNGTSFYINKMIKYSGNYSFKIYAVDLSGNTNVSETRKVILNLTYTKSLPIGSDGNVSSQVKVTSPSGNATVTIPKGTKATVNGTTITSIIIDSPISVPYSMTGDNRFIGENLRLGPDGAVFNELIIINFSYNDSQLIAAGNIPASRLKVKYYDVKKGWVDLTTNINETAKVVTFGTNHFSIFALTGTPEPASKPSSNSGGGSSGGGGGGGGSGENYTNIEVIEKYDKQISKDVLTSYTFTHPKNPIMFVKITGNTTIGVITTSIEVLKNTSTLLNVSPEGLIYKNANIWVGTSGIATPRNIKEALIKFKVNNVWMSTNGVQASDIVLMKWNKKSWIDLETKVLSKDNTNTYFEGETTAFSPFAIVAKTTSGVAFTMPISVETPKIAATETPEPRHIYKKETKNVPWFEIVLTIAVLTAIVLAKRR